MGSGGADAPDPTTLVTVVEPWVASVSLPFGRLVGPDPVEDALPDLDEHEVGEDHADQGGEEVGGQSLEAECVGERGRGEPRADCDDAESDGRRGSSVVMAWGGRPVDFLHALWLVHDASPSTG